MDSDHCSPSLYEYCFRCWYASSMVDLHFGEYSDSEQLRMIREIVCDFEQDQECWRSLFWRVKGQFMVYGADAVPEDYFPSPEFAAR